jgi:AAHS family 4-hydroxybenzoate transporter-like MFS transporter
MRNSVTEIIDSRKVGPLQILLVACVLLALAIDGLDIQLLALVAPVILVEWGTDKASFGPALAAALAGMTVGATVGGWLGDQRGRKTVLVLSVFLFGAATAAASLTQGVVELTLLRLLSGLGFGAAGPNGVALATEWLPQRARVKVAALLSVGTPLGGMIGASLLLWLLPVLGWRDCFVACGVLTLLLGFAMVFVLPESPGFLLTKGRRQAAERLLQKVIASDVRLPEEAADDRADTAPSVARESIFGAGYGRANIGIWCTSFCITFLAYSFAAWGPVFLTMSGFTLPDALRASFAFNVSAVTAAALTGFAVARFGSRRPLLLFSFACLVCVVMLGAALTLANGTPTPLTHWIVPIAFAGAGGCSAIVIAITYSIMSHVYPVSCRASGLGAGLTAGRAGGVATTLSGGAMLELGGTSTAPFFALLAAVGIAALVGSIALDRHIPADPRGR